MRGGIAGWFSSARALPDPLVFVGRNMATLPGACVQRNLTLVLMARVPYSHLPLPSSQHLRPHGSTLSLPCYSPV